MIFDKAFAEKNAAQVNNIKINIIADMKREVAQSKLKADKIKQKTTKDPAALRTQIRRLKKEQAKLKNKN